MEHVILLVYLCLEVVEVEGKSSVLNDLFVSREENICALTEYDNKKIADLMNNKDIIRNRLKIKSSINNSKIFKRIQKEYGSFNNYIWSFTNNKIIDENFEVTRSELSDTISNDLKKRGMNFVGTVIIYSYLQAIGIINSHSKECFCYKGEEK